MSLTFDYVTMPPKSQEVSQIQTGEQVRYEHGQQEMAAQFGKEIKNQSEQTIRRREADNDPDLRDSDERKGKGRQQKRGKKRDKSSSEQAKEQLQSGHLDIRI